MGTREKRKLGRQGTVKELPVLASYRLSLTLRRKKGEAKLHKEASLPQSFHLPADFCSSRNDRVKDLDSRVAIPQLRVP